MSYILHKLGLGSRTRMRKSANDVPTSPRHPAMAKRRNSHTTDDILSFNAMKASRTKRDTQLQLVPNQGRRRSLSHPNLKSLDTTIIPSCPSARINEQPVVLSAHPMTGSVKGGTRISITGAHFGLGEDDLTAVYICGSNCLFSLEYESSARIYCTTKPWRACGGDIVVTTKDGGRGVSKFRFTFKDDTFDTLSAISSHDSLDEGIHSPLNQSNISPVGSNDWEKQKSIEEWMHNSQNEATNTELLARLREENENLLKQVQVLETRNKDLQIRNTSLDKYIERVISVVIDKMPSVLCTDKQ